MIDYLNYMTRVYEFQDNGFYYDNLESMLRTINPNAYTLTQNNLNELISQRHLDETIDHFSNLACLKLLGQNNRKVTGLAGIFIRTYDKIQFRITSFQQVFIIYSAFL